MSGESNSASMSGLRDPLLTYFMEESAAKEVKLTQQKRLISKLQLELTASRAQYASIWSVQDRLLERIRMYQSMLRRSRDRVITLEERIAMFTGSSHLILLWLIVMMIVILCLLLQMVLTVIRLYLFAKLLNNKLVS